jgi:drug/metabolite transporter (DMT)-like permease
MLIALVTPVVAVILGMLVLDEEFGWRTLAGGAMIMLGIALIVVRKGLREMREIESGGKEAVNAQKLGQQPKSNHLPME